MARFYIDEDGNKIAETRIWDTYRYITEIKKSDKSFLRFYATVRDGVRYIFMQEYVQHTDGIKPTTNSLSIPMYMPVDKGTNIIKPYIEFLKAYQDVVIAHNTDVPLDDPETAVIKKRIVYTEKELRERKEAKKNEQTI